MAVDRTVVAALIRTALATLDELAARGLETSDVPRLWLDATLRWAREEAPPREIAPYSRDLLVLQVEPGFTPTGAFRDVVWACDLIRGCRGRVSQNALRAVIEVCGGALAQGAGEPEAAALARVRAWVEAFAAEEAQHRARRVTP